MTIKELILAIAEKHSEAGITVNRPASSDDILRFEGKIGFSLPNDFREFYSICNGFSCEEDMINIIPLNDIDHYGKGWFYFSEYMIYSDMWMLQKVNGSQYQIANGSYKNIVLTNFLSDFLKRFLRGNVFDKGGLYDWQEELKQIETP
jgi:cell wall assembly regulator SMI1